jgi:hypothetical protein
MVSFADRALLQLSNPSALTALLAPDPAKLIACLLAAHASTGAAARPSADQNRLGLFRPSAPPSVKQAHEYH